ncbi:DUF2140 family protein [Weissella confusa]|uniref:DUF2140 family protein n=1 Tax=Weissella confusa TaxID=1583 RepID=UPI002477DEAE|nr:DUF2140 family protein [Weissella confusa]
MEPRKVTRFGVVMPSRERVQGIITGIGITLVALVALVIVLILLPQDRTEVTDTKPQIGQASFTVAVDRKELNALVEQYLNNDPALKDKFRFEMTKSGMMVYGTYKLLGQNVDFVWYEDGA